MKAPKVVDGRNIYEPAVMADLGFEYRGIGRGYDRDGNPVDNNSKHVEILREVSN